MRWAVGEGVGVRWAVGEGVCVYVYVYVFVYEGIVCVSVISVRACVRLVERIKVVCVCVGM